MDSKVGWTVTSFEVENSILSSALRSMPPSAIVAVLSVFWDDDVKRLKLGIFSGGILRGRGYFGSGRRCSQGVPAKRDA